MINLPHPFVIMWSQLKQDNVLFQKVATPVSSMEDVFDIFFYTMRFVDFTFLMLHGASQIVDQLSFSIN